MPSEQGLLPHFVNPPGSEPAPAVEGEHPGPTISGAVVLPAEDARATKRVLNVAVGQGLSAVRGGDMPLDLALLMQDEKTGSEIIYRIGQRLGLIGLRGSEREEAHERLAGLNDRAKTLLAEIAARDDQSDQMR